MGYNTRYSLTIRHESHPRIVELPEIIADTREAIPEAKYCLNSNGDCSEAGKWYEHEADLKAFSTFYPRFVFILQGEGEGRGEGSPDMWIKYFLNGKLQVCKPTLTYPPFDKSKLV